MTADEFSNGWDALVNSYAVSAGYGQQDALAFNEWEKSVFLTDAQEKLVIDLYSGRNPIGAGFEETEELRRYLEKLVVEAVLTPASREEGSTAFKVSDGSTFFNLPDDTNKPVVWFIIYEQVKTDTITGDDCHSGKVLEVVPVRHDEYHRLKHNPFRGANDRRALRLDISNSVVEIVSKYPIVEYSLRYLRKPYPILLDSFDGMTVRDEDTPNNPCCELPESLHQRILEMGVLIGLQSKGISLRGVNSEQKKE